MASIDLRELERFIIAARERTALGQGRRVPPERPGAVEIVYREGGLSYRDSYFGQSQILGQEVVRRAGLPVWVMNYRIVVRDLGKSGEELAAFLQRAQQARYRDRHLLGEYVFQERDLRYVDRSEGSLDLFQGETLVLRRERELFCMHYCGGLVHP